MIRLRQGYGGQVGELSLITSGITPLLQVNSRNSARSSGVLDVVELCRGVAGLGNMFM